MTPEQRQDLADFATSCGATIRATDANDNVIVRFTWGDFETFVSTLGDMYGTAKRH